LRFKQDNFEAGLVPNPTILIVEDEVLTGDHLKRTLKRLGYEVAGIAGNAAKALQMIEARPPDLLLADIGLDGDVDGIEVAARAREEWDIPTVFLTAFSDPETLRRSRITEAYGFLIKPFVDQELHATIEIALQQKALRTQHQFEADARARILVRTQEELRDVTGRLLDAQEQERAEIARDLHDDIGQRIALLQMDFENLWQKISPEARQQHKRDYEHAIRGVGELSHIVRNVSHRLHPKILDDLGLVVALRQLAEQFEERYCIPTRFSSRSVPEKVKAEIAVPLYRITQEALRNVTKHAGPARVNVALVGAPSTIELSVRDNGKGFDPACLPRSSGLGLVSMVERVAALHGQVKIDSRPGEGTRIHVSIRV
jgi:signal transduction histidine kinase